MNEADWKLVENVAFVLGMLQTLIAACMWLVLKDTGVVIWSIVVLAFSLYLSTYAHVKRVVEHEMDERMLTEARKKMPPEQDEK